MGKSGFMNAPVPRKRAYVSLTGATTLHLRNPYVIASWSAAFPCLGHLLMSKYLRGFPLFLWEVVINYQAHINLAILYSVIGKFEIVSSGLDMIGIAMNLWCYPINVCPLMPEFVLFDICTLPVATMLCIQFFPKVSPYIKSVIYSIAASFIFQPVNEWLGLYEGTQWKGYYSVSILILIYLAANHLATKDKFAEFKKSQL